VTWRFNPVQAIVGQRIARWEYAGGGAAVPVGLSRVKREGEAILFAGDEEGLDTAGGIPQY
jgi:hypothetical protein